MVTAKVRFGHISFDGTSLILHHKGSIAGHTDSRIPVSSISGVGSSKELFGPTIVDVWVVGAPGRGYSHKFSFRRRHARQVHAVLAAAGWPL
jgi:hypothetical protein